ncbi:MAG: multicopper oxidase domain-containing protein [Kofleriaceae bacterium]
MSDKKKLSRRDLLKYGGAASGATALLGKKAWAVCTDTQPIDPMEYMFSGCGVGSEPLATSPFITQPFIDPMPVPQSLRPGWRRPDGTLAPAGDPDRWRVRKSVQFGDNTIVEPGPAPGQQDALGDRPGNNALAHPEWGIPNAGTHQLWSSGPGVMGQDLGLPDPLLFHVRLQVAGHDFTSSPVRPIDSSGQPVTLPPGAPATPLGDGTYQLPPSTIYGFNGTFPGPMINAEYGRPVLVRFENDLDYNPACLPRGDFGAPDWAFLTHLHNGHTAPESDGNPSHMVDHEGGYLPGEWSDNLYLNYPAGNDSREKQSFMWFHDHRMHHTGANVYKGLVGLYPIYDPELDNGDETQGLRLPGVRTDNGDGTFDVAYDIPMALYDVRLNDGVTAHQDQHVPTSPDPRLPGELCGATHPEWWGQPFYKHYPNHGFVGDIFTVNGKAFPVLRVKRRKYRFRFLGASVARQYELSFRTGTPTAYPGMQGQYNFAGPLQNGTIQRNRGQLMFPMYQIASEGGLLPKMIKRNSIQIWPAKRREVVVDFTTDVTGAPVPSGTVVYLTNTLQMLDGRKATDNQEPGFDPRYAVPMVKIIIEDDAPDASLLPTRNQVLREAPPVDRNATKVRDFTLTRSGTAGGEHEWLINNLHYDPLMPMATPVWGTAEAWGVNNGGGGWTHPMHIHQEEHQVIYRSSPASLHPDDTGKEDVVALEPSEQTIIYRRFRTFLGNYVGHCHQLLHEDHSMMFGWLIRKP